MKRLKLALALALLVCAGPALSQYPNKPIRFIVGFPPGGSADPTTRIIGNALQEQLKQPVVVENRPGADSALAAERLLEINRDDLALWRKLVKEAGIPLE